ncbi:MAG: matrixin family metalloprotease [Bdellovibrionia bacterium]
MAPPVVHVSCFRCRSQRVGFQVILLALAFQLLTPPTSAYVKALGTSGKPLHWGKRFFLSFLGNPENQSELEHQALSQAMTQGLRRWREATSNQLQFRYKQGVDQRKFETQSQLDQHSRVYFISQSHAPPQMSRSVLGMTQIWYTVNQNEIFEADIALNDRDFQFTNHPKDSTLHPPFSETRKPRVYLQNVLTHELGHAIGLSHSAALQATMLFVESPEQSHLSCDDQIGAQALYPAKKDSARGSIEGTLTFPQDKPVLGAHVVAISESRGTVMASTLTDQQGHYTIEPLEPGGYFLMVEPFYADPQVLPEYYQNLNRSSPCDPQQTWKRSFLVGDPKLLSVSWTSFLHGPSPLVRIRVEPHQKTRVKPFALSCEQTPENRAWGRLALPLAWSFDPFSKGFFFQDPPIALKNLSANPRAEEIHFDQEARFAFVDHQKRIPSPETLPPYHLPEVSGRLITHALSYSLYSPLQVSLQLQTAEHAEIATPRNEPVFQESESGFQDQDTRLQTEPLEKGDYFVHLTFKPLTQDQYPAGSTSLDSEPFFLILGSLDAPPPPLEGTLPHRPRCRSAETFPHEGDLGGTNGDESSPSVGACGRLEKKRSRSSQTQIASFLSFLISCLLPWIALRSENRLLLLFERIKKSKL